VAAQKETPPDRKYIQAAREVSTVADWTPIGLLIFAAVVPIAIAMWWGRPSTFADLITMILLGLFVFAVIANFAIIVLWGLKRLDLPERFMSWLGGATVGEIIGLSAYIVHHIFKS
jgi:hypothetical protein